MGKDWWFKVPWVFNDEGGEPGWLVANEPDADDGFGHIVLELLEAPDEPTKRVLTSDAFRELMRQEYAGG